MTSEVIHRVPALNKSKIEQIVSDVYGIQVKYVRELGSYYDRNYLVEFVSSHLSNETRTDLIHKHLYMFKVNNSFHSKLPKGFDIQAEAMVFAKERGFPLPAPIPNLEGSYRKLVQLNDDQRGTTENYGVGLLEFLPGKALDEVPQAFSSSICFQMGHHLGWAARLFQNFKAYDVSTIKAVTKREWNMSLVPEQMWGLADLVEDKERREMVRNILHAFEEDVFKYEDTLSQGMVHNDMNTRNILVTENDDVNHNNTDVNNQNCVQQKYRISGVIDFSDCSHTCYLYDVGIPVAYAMSMANQNDVPLLEAAGSIVCGYMKHIPLSDFELERLRICACVRMLMPLVYGLQDVQLNPENREYLFHYRKLLWLVLEKVWRITDEEFVQGLRNEMKKHDLL